jgi:hypothetical protein
MNTDDMALAVIEEQADRTIRRAAIGGDWYFSVVDVIAVLTDTPTPNKYWTDMKRRITDEGFAQLAANCRSLKLTAADGKQRPTDAADVRTMLRIVQSVPSPKAEPIKQWLARVGEQHISEEAQLGNQQVPSGHLLDTGLLELAEYHEQLARVYRQQANLRTRLESVEVVTRSHDQQLLDILLRLESLESNQTALPDMLALLRPENLSQAHQTLLKRWTNDLCRLTGWHLNMIWQDLVVDFGYDNFSDATEADWQRIADWFQVRLEDATKRR